MLETAIRKLNHVQQEILDTLAPLSDADCRRQFHHDLSPIGWHLMHTVFTENLWLHERILGDPSFSKDERRYYLPETAAKSARGCHLPELKEMLQRANDMQTYNRSVLQRAPKRLRDHPLMDQYYLLYFLIQHHAMHLETIRLALMQKQINSEQNHRVEKPLSASRPESQWLFMDAGDYTIGGRHVLCFDNERSEHQQNLKAFLIGEKPVSNAEYLGFIENDGYQNKKWWSQSGWRWREKQSISAPDHWRQDAQDLWYGHDKDGACDLAPNDPVYGIGWHEAYAYAQYAGGRLPYEYEWEAACQRPAMVRGRVWEWCANAFAPYPGFRPYPYEGYSTPWFDGRHYTLKGTCRYSPKILQRKTMRNFHYAWKRHVCAGLRLACSHGEEKTAAV